MPSSTNGVTIPKWIASVVVAAVLGWAGSWIGYNVHTGAAFEARVAVLEQRANRGDNDRKEIIDQLGKITSTLGDFGNKLESIDQRLSWFMRPSSTAERLRSPSFRASDVVCKADEEKIRAANGEYFCRKR